jgi:hypothetical protein
MLMKSSSAPVNERRSGSRKLLSHPSIEALSPVFSADPNPRIGQFSVTLSGANNLLQIGADLAGDPNAFVGLYVPESCEPEYNDDAEQYGRVVALVRMLPMPLGRTIHNYPSGCIEYDDKGQRYDRWPIGWPHEMVFYSEHGGPVLRDAVLVLTHIHQFADFVYPMQQGPMSLRKLPQLRIKLMQEIRNEIARNPSSRLLPF